jgi:hypothetical protein
MELRTLVAVLATKVLTISTAVALDPEGPFVVNTLGEQGRVEGKQWDAVCHAVNAQIDRENAKALVDYSDCEKQIEAREERLVRQKANPRPLELCEPVVIRLHLVCK